jgi:hypothetical protein
MDGCCLYILNASDRGKDPTRLEPAISGIREAHSAAVAPVRGIRLGAYPDLRPDGASALFQGTPARFRLSPPPSRSPPPVTSVAREE